MPEILRQTPLISANPEVLGTEPLISQQRTCGKWERSRLYLTQSTGSVACQPMVPSKAREAGSLERYHDDSVPLLELAHYPPLLVGSLMTVHSM